MESGRSILVCFAVKEEARFFDAQKAGGGCRVVVTGMGRRNATAGIQKAVGEQRPELVITAGYAGGLDPALRVGTVIFDSDAAGGFAHTLEAAGARPAEFHCAEKVAVTPEEKAALRLATGADAVEMESSLIRTYCQHMKIPAATVRVISDAADEALPLDFNALMTTDCKINFVKLAQKLALSPGKIGALLRFQKQTTLAAQALADVLHRALLVRQ